MNETAEGTFVKTERESPIEAAQARAARGAESLGIERKRIDEWRIAAGAPVLGFMRNGGLDARVAYGNTSPFGERAITNPTIRGEEKRKKAVGDRLDCGGSRSRYATREGAPPIRIGIRSEQRLLTMRA